MRRRSALAAFASLGTAALAGCSLDREELHDDPPTVQPSTETTERTPTATATPEASTPRPGDVPAERVVDGEAVAENGVGVTADRWFALEALRYENGDGEHETVTSDRGWFVAWEFTVANRGDSRVDALPDSVFELRVDGETSAHLHEFPGGVSFGALDQPDSEPQVRELAWYGGLDPGEAVSLQLVYEAPVRRDYRHYLAWDPESPVEGASEPVYLTGQRVLPGAE
ncbi:hypothetical protein SAMN05216559_2284 [Halomicrobium zhouii]|uniref:Uncharacterized protein n=1 Tax=Halomicrobium zhouii TaxID=767519 RepID=A0A1I6L9K6_9EURY|nr:hypothetical protein [Halomicrobium zhouii]SFR99940.1 hypothetical protein SAMN05216559_2284 [Halomicrobium zhouii]